MIIPFSQLCGWRKDVRRRGQKLVVTNGCFDILHAGHVRYLELARRDGDVLLIGLNSDVSVRALKGEGRPINREAHRAAMLDALRCVQAVCIFDSPKATMFLDVAKPDVYVKANDYTLETLDPNELAVLQQCGAQIIFAPLVPGVSTTQIIERLKA